MVDAQKAEERNTGLEELGGVASKPPTPPTHKIPQKSHLISNPLHILHSALNLAVFY